MLTRISSSGVCVSKAPGSPKALQRLHNCITYLWPSMNWQRAQTKTTYFDAIDYFTNDLVSTKTKKWYVLCDTFIPKETKTGNTSKQNVTPSAERSYSFAHSVGLLQTAIVSDIKNMQSPQLGLDIRLLSQAQLDNLLMSTLEIKNRVDFLFLIEQCVLWTKLPSDEVIVPCLKYLSNIGHFQHIESLEIACKASRHNIITKFADFAVFKAMALWRSGGARAALSTLHAAYSTSAESEDGMRMLRNAFRNITEETLQQKSEAVLVTLNEVARNIYTDHKDLFIIACVWKQCFMSDWFCDQRSAANLFENYTELQQLVSRRSNALSSTFLRNNKVDAVHRLIELFLQYKQSEACSNCLSLLFNYQFMRRDLRACAEIVKSCSELDIPLSELQNERFLSLFLDHSEAPNIRKCQETRKKQYLYKF